MYGLDVNFLKDREIRPVEQNATVGSAAPAGDRRPLFAGLVVAVAAQQSGDIGCSCSSKSKP